MVIVAAGRAARPHQFTGAADDTRAGDCPFCPGFEDATPPEVARTGAGEAGDPDWRVRVFPNLYPIVGGANAGPGTTGVHEVVALSPGHAASLGELDDTHAAEVFLVVRDRVRTHLAAGHAFGLAIVNHRRAAGASIAHPHAQVFALDLVPPAVEGAVARFADAGDDLVLLDARAGYPVLDDADAIPGVLAWSPYAASSPALVRIAHEHAGPDFAAATDEQVIAVAHATRAVLARLHAWLADPPYNLVVHTAPPGTARGRLPLVRGDHAESFGGGGIRAGHRGVGEHHAPRAGRRRPPRDHPGMTATIRIAVMIDAPPDAVWRAVERIETHTEWMADAESITFRSEAHSGVGAAFDCVTRVGPLHTTDHFVVTRWDPSVAMGIEHRGAVTGTGEFVLTPFDDGTATQFSWEESLRFPWWLGGPVGEVAGKPVLERIWRGNLRRLKTIVERGPVA